jgi:hypothetical protein
VSIDCRADPNQPIKDMLVMIHHNCKSFPNSAQPFLKIIFVEADGALAEVHIHQLIAKTTKQIHLIVNKLRSKKNQTYKQRVN